MDRATSRVARVPAIALRRASMFSHPTARAFARDAPTRVMSHHHHHTRLSACETFDVVALGNLCVDVLCAPAPIPPPRELKTKRALDALMTQSSDRTRWELGGNCNFVIAAARLGLSAASAGHVGDDRYGEFVARELAIEGVQHVELISRHDRAHVSALAETLVCFVLSDGAGAHAFCSRYDLGPWPLMRDVSEVSNDARDALRRCRAVFVNGFVFDELKPRAVKHAVGLAKSNGAGVFFDPGPRAFTFADATNASRLEALDVALCAADVVLATEEELAALTGVPLRSAPERYAEAIFNYPNSAAEWVVVKRGADGAFLVTRDGHSVAVGCPVVKVGDTVGCGDSSAAAYVLGYLRARAEPALDVGEALETTVTLATHVGSATAMNLGAGRNVARAETVLDLLSEGATGKTRGVSKVAAAAARSVLQDAVARRGSSQIQLS